MSEPDLVGHVLPLLAMLFLTVCRCGILFFYLSLAHHRTASPTNSMYIGNEPLEPTKKVLQEAFDMRSSRGQKDGPLEYILKLLNDDERVKASVHVDGVTKRRVHNLSDDASHVNGKVAKSIAKDEVITTGPKAPSKENENTHSIWDANSSDEEEKEEELGDEKDGDGEEDSAHAKKERHGNKAPEMVKAVEAQEGGKEAHEKKEGPVESGTEEVEDGAMVFAAPGSEAGGGESDEDGLTSMLSPNILSGRESLSKRRKRSVLGNSEL